MSFKPSIHGWAFADSFTVEGPAYGLGSSPAFMALGGGMCWASLDRYLDGRVVPRTTSPPEPGTPLHAELHRRQVAALHGVWARLRDWQGLPDTSWRDRLPVRLTPGRRDAASLTRRAWREVRKELSAGRPALLTLVEIADGYARPTAGRQVLAFGWAPEGHRVALSIYDPDKPGQDDIRLAFSLHGPLDARLTGGDRVRGFFHVPYDRRPGQILAPQTFGDRSVLGLNRKVRGRPGAVAAGRALHLVARDADGALLHFHRRRGRHWVAANITERENLGSSELHSDPVPLAPPFGVPLHAFARSYVGDLLHFRLVRRWTVRNRTEHRRAGARFRLEGPPVAVDLPWGGACVVGRGREGALVAYSCPPLRGWRAEEVPAAGGRALTGDPAAIRIGPVVHVIARSREGHVLHFERTSAGWSAGDLMSLCAAAQPVSERPLPIVHDGLLHLFARTAEGHRLLHMVRDQDGQWTAQTIGGAIASAPAVTEGPAGLHVFAAAPAAGLLHAWSGNGRWSVEDLLETRAQMPPAVAPATGLVAWGTSDELRLTGRSEAGVVEWVWRPDADWTAGLLSERAGYVPAHEPGDDLLLAREPSGAFHLFSTDGSGTIVHVEAGEWRPVEGPGRPGSAEKTADRRAGRPPEEAPLSLPTEAESEEAGLPLPDSGPPPGEEPLRPVAAGLPLLEDPEPEDEVVPDLPLLEAMDLNDMKIAPAKKPAPRRQGPALPQEAPPPWPERG